MRAVLLVSVMALCACFRPNLPSGAYRCTQSSECPEEMSCVNGLCYRPEDLPADAGAAGAMGCASGGTALSLRVSACRGSFAQGNAAALCAAGYHVCDPATDRTALATVTAAQCNSAGGFYALALAAGIQNNDVACPAKRDPMALVGCGMGSGVRSVGLNECTVLNQVPAMRTAINCALALDPWSCTQGFTDAVNRDPKGGGVLCCKTQ